jgi:hypothetical protein
MAKQVFVPKVDDLVRSKQLKGVFKVTGVQMRGEKCFIQEFNVSKRVLIDETHVLVARSTLIPASNI